MRKPGNVMFVGGELDGKMYVLPELPPRYRVPYLRHNPMRYAENVDPSAPVDFKETEYVLTERDGACFYVERELLKLSEAQGVDPRPDVGPASGR